MHYLFFFIQAPTKSLLRMLLKAVLITTVIFVLIEGRPNKTKCTRRDMCTNRLTKDSVRNSDFQFVRINGKVKINGILQGNSYTVSNISRFVHRIGMELLFCISCDKLLINDLDKISIILCACRILK